MYKWTPEARKIADEIRDYIVDGKVVPGAPEGTQEKYDKVLAMLKKNTENDMIY